VSTARGIAAADSAAAGRLAQVAEAAQNPLTVGGEEREPRRQEQKVVASQVGQR